MSVMDSLITLTTDFGYQDGFVAAMKGVILTINPAVTLIDVTHGIPRQDIFAGALLIADTLPYFPKQAIHVVVIDPGVGGEREAMVAVTEHGRLVLPDNGLISFLARKIRVKQTFAVTNRKLCLDKISRTFHGRDIFAPVAAHLSLGLPPSSVGRTMSGFHTLAIPKSQVRGAGIEGEIIYMDTYGNLMTSIPWDLLKGCASWRLEAGSSWITGPARTYGDVAVGEALFLENGSGYLEIAVNQGHAGGDLHMKPGNKIWLMPHKTKGP